MDTIAAAEPRAATAEARRASWRDRLEHAIFRVALAVCGAVPLRFALPLGGALGLLFYLCDVPDRRVALQNLAFAFPNAAPAERRRLLRATCRHLGRTAFEIAHLPALTHETLPQYVEIADPARLQQVLAQARERGAIILTAHFGNWELLAYACGLLGFPVTLIHRPMRNPLVDRAIDALRARAGTHAIAKKAAAREALRRLKAHALVAIAADQNQVRDCGVFVDFFGLPACTTAGPARLAMLTGAPIVPVFLVRDGARARHRMVILPAIELAASGDRAADIRETTRRCTAVIEQMVRAHPDHWIWFHKRWKTRPDGAPRIY